MIYAIVAIDDKNGLADDKGIPWDLPTDKAFFRQKTATEAVLMGRKTYEEFTAPLSKGRNLVATHHPHPLHSGFEAIEDVNKLLSQFKSNQDALWVIGGAGLFEKTFSDIDTLYLTRVSGDFSCTKFFPDFKDQFNLVEQGPQQTESGIRFRFEVWQRNKV